MHRCRLKLKIAHTRTLLLGVIACQHTFWHTCPLYLNSTQATSRWTTLGLRNLLVSNETPYHCRVLFTSRALFCPDPRDETLSFKLGLTSHAWPLQAFAFTGKFLWNTGSLTSATPCQPQGTSQLFEHCNGSFGGNFIEAFIHKEDVEKIRSEDEERDSNWPVGLPTKCAWKCRR